MAGEMNGEGADPKPLHMTRGPSVRRGLLDMPCPGGKICGCMASRVEEPDQWSQKTLTDLPMVVQERDKEGRWQTETEVVEEEGFLASFWLRARQVLGLSEEDGPLKGCPVIRNRPDFTVLTQESKRSPTPKPRGFACIRTARAGFKKPCEKGAGSLASRCISKKKKNQKQNKTLYDGQDS